MRAGGLARLGGARPRPADRRGGRRRGRLRHPRGPAARRDVVEVLHLAGAEDGFIARLFQVALRPLAAHRRGLLGGARRGAGRRAACGSSAAARASTPVLPVRLERPGRRHPLPAPRRAVAAVAARLTRRGRAREHAVKGLAAVLVVALIWVAGLLAFADRVPGSTPAAEPAAGRRHRRPDRRLQPAHRSGDAAAGGRQGPRLLVSGVNREVTRADAARRHRRRASRSTTAASTWASPPPTPSATPARPPTGRGHGYQQPDPGHRRLPHAPRHAGAARGPARALHHTLSGGDAGARRPPLVALTAGAPRWMVVEYCKYLAILGRETVPGRAAAAAGRRPSVILARSLPSSPSSTSGRRSLAIGCCPLLLAPAALAAGGHAVLGAGVIVPARAGLRHPGRVPRPRAHAHRRRP